jgi:hypothetical protein
VLLNTSYLLLFALPRIRAMAKGLFKRQSRMLNHCHQTRLSNSTYRHINLQLSFQKCGCACFVVFRLLLQVFVANPNKPPAIVDILRNNKEKLLKYLEEFHTDRGAGVSCGPSRQGFVGCHTVFSRHRQTGYVCHSMQMHEMFSCVSTACLPVSLIVVGLVGSFG